MNMSHEVYDDVRNILNVWNHHLEHPHENPEEVKNKVTTSLREILLPETWKLRLKILELPVQLPTMTQTISPIALGSRPTGPSTSILNGSASLGASGSSRPVTVSGQTGHHRPGLVDSLLSVKPEGVNVNGGIRVEAPFISKLLGLLW